jgi:tetratricopeptide (TPR) repeat protein
MILNSLDDGKGIQHVFNQAVALVRRSLPRPSPYMVPLYDHWEVFETYIPHVLSLQSTYLKSHPPLCGTPQFAELLCNAGAYLYERGLSASGLAVLCTAEQVCAELREEHFQWPIEDNSDLNWTERSSQSLMASDLASLRANVLAYSWGINAVTGGLRVRARAHAMAKMVVDLREKHMSSAQPTELTISDHLLLANSYNDLAFQYIDEEQYDLAEPYITKSLHIKNEFSAENVPLFEFATPKKDLALVRLAQGRHTEALKLCMEARDLIEKEEGYRSASTQLFRFILAVVLFNVGNISASKEIHDSVLISRLSKFGETGFVTMHSYFWVALCQYHLGEYSDARSVYIFMLYGI